MSADSADGSLAPLSTTGTVSAARTVSDAVRTCAKCGEPIVRRRVRASHDLSLCLRCEQRARASAYFQVYYTTNKQRILEKNRRWAKEHAQLLAERRRQRAPERIGEARQCIGCGTALVRAERCRRCHVRYRYANDPEYRARRLAITRRWLRKRARTPAQARHA
jgi:hypothetical protein